MQTKKRIILGSASPRRRELLEQIGISFEVRVSDKEEVYHSLIPEEIVKELALSKAENVADDLREKQEQVKQISFDKKNNVLLDTIVIGADTIVVSDGSILGKPKDEADAVREEVTKCIQAWQFWIMTMREKESRLFMQLKRKFLSIL